ncbi:MAG TPA: zinc-binding alcohol dehydrogenase family protein [Woeseiaceae bacterium]|nr:zinc-binding alcohol dehydrogenase family protein [Woeseiaceae bacterium]
MKAVAFKQSLPIEDPQSLLDVTLPDPGPPRGRDLLVRVHAVSVNPVDTKQRAAAGGEAAAPRVLGFDAAGTVETVGDEATLFKPGDAVYYAGDISRPGSNSELQLVDERIVGAKPRSMDFDAAAAMPLTAITAWEALFDRMKIDPDGAQRGTTVLVIGGAGGVGSIGIQLAKIAGLVVIATASRPESTAWVKELGADHVVDHTQPMRPQMQALGLRHVDYVAVFNDIDRHWQAACDLVRPQGAIVSIVASRAPLAQDALRAKSGTLAWEAMFTRPRLGLPDMIEQHRLLGRVAEWIDAGRVRGTLRERLSPINAAHLRAAHRRIEAGRMIGKLVLVGWD